MSVLKIKKGDKVIVLSGKDKGKIGVVEKISLKTKTLIIGGVNIVKKHVKASKQNPAGGLVEITRPLSVAKVKLVCPSCGKSTRVGYQVSSGNKQRICKKCGKAIEVVAKEAKEK